MEIGSRLNSTIRCWKRAVLDEFEPQIASEEYYWDGARLLELIAFPPFELNIIIYDNLITNGSFERVQTHIHIGRLWVGHILFSSVLW